MDVLTHKQEPFLGGVIVYPKEANEATFKAFTEHMNRNSFDPDEAAEISYVYSGADKVYSATLNTFHPGSSKNPKGLQRWESIKPQTLSTIRTANMTDFAREIDVGQALNR